MSNMSLKEAFRYQNHISDIYAAIANYLRQTKNVTSVTENHMRSKANPEAVDEVVKVEMERDFDVPTARLIALLVQLAKERGDLVFAIEKAKAAAQFNLDAAIAANTIERELSRHLEMITYAKTSRRMRTGTGYKFDVEGKQQPYVYDIEETTTVEFDRAQVKKIANAYLDKCDENSRAIDLFTLETEIEFEPKYGMNENVEDIVMRCCADE